MADKEKLLLLEKMLGAYPVAMDPQQVGEALGVTRRYVDKLIDDGKLPAFVLDDSKTYKQKRVNKAALIAFMLNDRKTNRG